MKGLSLLDINFKNKNNGGRIQMVSAECNPNRKDKKIYTESDKDLGA